MKIQLSDHFTIKKLIRFVLPSVIMMIFTSVYGVVDGFFVSNYAGKTPFAAVNLIMPFIMFVGAVGFMVGTGGSALVSKLLGQGDRKKANETFSLLVYFVFALGVAICVISQLFLKRVSLLLGADEEMLVYCVKYGRISLISMPFFMLQNVFESFIITAERPNFGLAVTVLAGVNNIVFDFLFVGMLEWGVEGAAAATAISEFIGGGVPLVYFIFNKSSIIRLGRTSFDFKAIIKTCTNGVSELLTNISMSFVTMIYNYQLMRFFGENGVAAYGAIMYVNFIFSSLYIGYSIGVAPIIGFNYGAQNHKELKNVFKKSVVFYSLTGVIMTASAMLLSRPLAQLFTGYDRALYTLTVTAFMMFAVRYLFSGFNIFGSAFFTALNNGGVSAVISFSRTMIFQIATVFLVPLLFGAENIWFSEPVSECLALLLTAALTLRYRNKYKYF